MGMAEKLVSWLIAAACIVMLLRLAMGARRQQKFDRAARGAWYAIKGQVQRLYRRQATKKQAEKATQEILQRMRHQVDRKGNVITPKSFRRDDE